MAISSSILTAQRRSCISSIIPLHNSLLPFSSFNTTPLPSLDVQIHPVSYPLSFSFSACKTKPKRKKSDPTMSWQTYVDEHLMYDIEGTGNHLTASAILGHDGSVWAQSSAFPQFKPEEIKGIMTEFDEAGHLALNGLYLGGTKYMLIQGEPGAVIRGKKGPGGITIKKTGQALIFGIYEEPVTPGQCNMIVEKLGDYLIDQGM